MSTKHCKMQSTHCMQVFFGSFRGRGFPLSSAAARPSSAEHQPVHASAELAALVAESLAERHMREEHTEADAAATVSILSAAHEACRDTGAEAQKEGHPQRLGSPVPRHLGAKSGENVAVCAAAATSPAASSPQP